MPGNERVGSRAAAASWSREQGRIREAFRTGSVAGSMSSGIPGMESGIRKCRMDGEDPQEEL